MDGWVDGWMDGCIPAYAFSFMHISFPAAPTRRRTGTSPYALSYGFYRVPLRFL